MKDMTKCQYEYWYSEDKECPHEALKGKDVCYWHEERVEKDPIKEWGKSEFSNSDFREARHM